MIDINEIGPKIRRIRESQGVSTRQLSRLTDGKVGQSAVSDIERVEYYPSLEYFLAIMKALKINVADFLEVMNEEPLRGHIEEITGVHDKEKIAALTELLKEAAELNHDDIILLLTLVEKIKRSI